MQTADDLDALMYEVARYTGKVNTSVAYLLGLDARLLPEIFVADGRAGLGFPRLEEGAVAEMGGGYRFRSSTDVRTARR